MLELLLAGFNLLSAALRIGLWLTIHQDEFWDPTHTPGAGHVEPVEEWVLTRPCSAGPAQGALIPPLFKKAFKGKQTNILAGVVLA